MAGCPQVTTPRKLPEGPAAVGCRLGHGALLDIVEAALLRVVESDL